MLKAVEGVLKDIPSLQVEQAQEFVAPQLEPRTGTLHSYKPANSLHVICHTLMHMCEEPRRFIPEGQISGCNTSREISWLGMLNRFTLQARWHSIVSAKQ